MMVLEARDLHKSSSHKLGRLKRGEIECSPPNKPLAPSRQTYAPGRLRPPLEDRRIEQPQQEEQDDQDHISRGQVNGLRVDSHGCNVAERARLNGRGPHASRHGLARHRTGPDSAEEGSSDII
ncbi:unnamed protein product, partial [Iphiclides podalirius]